MFKQVQLNLASISIFLYQSERSKEIELN